jgi:hypothetical protein
VIAPRLSRFKGRAPPYYVEVPELHRRALSSGLIACDAIARVKQAALVCREAEHASKLGTPTQMSNISISHLRISPVTVTRRLAMFAARRRPARSCSRWDLRGHEPYLGLKVARSIVRLP